MISSRNIFVCSLVLLWSEACAKLLLRSSSLPYDYEEVICSFKGEKQPWCVDWLNCLRGKVGGDEAKVLEAWAPADCEEYCGRFPVTSPLEGQGTTGLIATSSRRNGTSLLARVESWLASVHAEQTALKPWTPSRAVGSTKSLRRTLDRVDDKLAVQGNQYAKTMREANEAIHFSLTKGTSMTGDESSKKASIGVARKVAAKPSADEMMEEAMGGFNCMTSCRKFQEGLSSCVGAIMLNPGSLAKMGAGSDSGDEGPEVCTKKDTPCLADLPLKYQRCLSKSTHAVLENKEFEDEDCATLASDFEECEGCPIYKQNPMEYISYVGGCKMRLNAYWQATHPRAGKHAHPGASGCQVH